MNKQTILKSIGKAYDHACDKHPFFAHKAMLDYRKEYTAAFLRHRREYLKYRINDRSVNGMDVLECEIAEALDSYANGEHAQCIHELYQCAAVIVRMVEMVEKETQNK